MHTIFASRAAWWSNRCTCHRRSSDIVALEDADVAAALRFIHNRVMSPIRVDDVVEHVQLSGVRWKSLPIANGAHDPRANRTRRLDG